MSLQRDKSAIEPASASESEIFLVKLLVKLGFLKPTFLQQKQVFAEYSPIAHFGHLGLLDEREAIKKVAEHLKTECFESTSADQDRISKLLEQEPISDVPIIAWRKAKAVPVSCAAQEITVAIANPLDMEAIRSLEAELGRRIRVVVGRETDIMGLVSKTIELKDALDFNEFLQEQISSRESLTDNSGLESNLTHEDIWAPTVVRLVNKILAGAILKGASDVHISPEQKSVHVRIRVDGIMRDFMEIPIGYRNALLSRLKLLCGMDITEKRHPQDGRLRLKTNQGIRDLRVSTVPTIHGENLVARILATDMSRLKIDTIGLAPAVLTQFKRALHSTSRIHLICGPTGSGKTSTLYAVLIYLKDGTQNIITVEDPIENRIEGITQIQVSHKIGLTFAVALRSILRQDPDVIMIGEIRDGETANSAIQMAQTGHAVLATVHTNTAAGAVTRLLDLGIPSFLIASSLGSVSAQRLVRLLCNSCKRPAGQEEMERARALFLRADNLMGAAGCELCDGTGYRGRTGVFSYLEITPAISSAIRESKGEDVIEQLGRSSGFITLNQAAIELVESGATSISEVERLLGPLDNLTVPYQEAEASGNSTVLPRNLSKRRILMVDDDENIRMVYRMLLEKNMYQVEEASNGLEALESVYRDPPSLVVLDLMMPKMNGIEALERLRSDPQLRNLPVLMLTAAANDENELKLIKNGADDFVSKTSNSDIIMARISRLLSK